MLKMNEKAPSHISDDFHPVKTEKQTLKSEFAKMKSLGLKGGLQYFWMYYRIPLLVCILVIITSVSIGATVIENRKPVLISANFVNNSFAIEDPNGVCHKYAAIFIFTRYRNGLAVYFYQVARPFLSKYKLQFYIYFVQMPNIIYILLDCSIRCKLTSITCI